MGRQKKPTYTEMEESLKWWREHADKLDKNWNSLHTLTVESFRKALGTPDATVPEMVQAVQKLKGVNRAPSTN